MTRWRKPTGLLAGLLLAGSLVACSGDEADHPEETPAVRPSEAQTVTTDGLRVTVEAGPHSALSAVLTIEADHPVAAEVTATAGDHRVAVPAPRRPRQIGRAHV